MFFKIKQKIINFPRQSEYYYFLFLYLFFSCIYIFFELKNFSLNTSNIIIFLIIFVLSVTFIYLYLNILIIYIVNNIDNIFNEKYFFYLSNNTTNSENEVKNIKEFLAKKQALFLEIAKENDKYENIIIFYPKSLNYTEKNEIISNLKRYFAFFSVYYFKKNDNLKKFFLNILVINFFILMLLFIKSMIIKYFEHLNNNYTSLVVIKTILLFIIVTSYFQYLIIWNKNFSPKNIKNIYLNLKKDLNVNIDILTIYIIDVSNNVREKKYSIKELIEKINNEIDDKYVKSLEITLQLLLAISYIGSLTIFGGL